MTRLARTFISLLLNKHPFVPTTLNVDLLCTVLYSAILVNNSIRIDIRQTRRRMDDWDASFYLGHLPARCARRRQRFGLPIYRFSAIVLALTLWASLVFAATLDGDGNAFFALTITPRWRVC